jgi:restriction system protein
MAVPDFQALMLPLLQIAGDDGDHHLSDAIDALAVQFRLSEEERRELLPSGRQAKFDNRVGWARTYLKKAGLLDSTGRGTFRIAERGLDVLKGSPPSIDVRFLARYPEFVEFKKATKREPEGEETGQTPEEALELGYQNLTRSLAQDLLERIKSCSPRFFENLVVDLLVAMGYGGSRKDAGQAVGQSGDGGIDGIIKDD